MSLFELFALQAHDADETAFAVDEAAFSATDVRLAAPAKVEINQDFVRDPSIRQRIEHDADFILGLKNGTKIEIPTFMRGTGFAADGAAAKGYADRVEGQFLRNAFGAESLGTGTTVDDVTPSATEFDVTSAAGLSIGQAVLVVTANGNEASVIGNIATNTITLVRALSAAPSNGAKVYGAATYYPVTDLTHTLQLQGLTAGAADHYYRCLGVQLVPKFANLNPGQQPLITYDGMAVSWVKKTGGSLAMASLDNTVNPPTVGYASTLMMGTVGATTRTVVHSEDIKIDPGLGAVQVRSVGGVQGCQAYGRTAVLPTLEVKVTEWDDAWDDVATTPTRKFVHYQIGSTPGNTILIELPSVAFNAIPQPASVSNSQLGQVLKGEGRGTGSTETDIARAPIRVHLL